MGEMNYLTDLTTHYIEGFAREGHTPFRMPLITEVEPGLWHGGCIHGAQLPEDFEFVVSLYPWERYDLGETTNRVEFQMYDAARMPDLRVVEAAADIVNRFRKQGKTLVHCQAGLNRSSLITGLALIRDGRNPQEVIDLLRRQRSPAVLCNKTFERFLLSQ